MSPVYDLKSNLKTRRSWRNWALIQILFHLPMNINVHEYTSHFSTIFVWRNKE